jgi:8-oxo-dGTP diphosphatase
MIDTALLDQLHKSAEFDGVTQLVVGAVISDSENVLLLLRPADDFMGGIFELPSGKVETGETLDAALIREVKEETGLDVASLTSYLGHFDYTSGSGKKSRQFNFAVKIATPEPILLTEHDTHTWANLDEQLPVTEAVQLVLDIYRTSAPR